MTTVAVSCPEGTDPNDCGFDPAITLTAGPSTLHFVITYGDDYTVDQACQFSEIGGVCQITEIGDQSLLVTATDVDTETMTGISTTTSTSAFGADMLMTADITLVAGQTAGLDIVSTATATGTFAESSDSLLGTTTPTRSSTHTSAARTETSSSSGSSSSSSSSSRSSSATSSSSTRAPNAAATLAPGAAGLGLMGLVALLL